MNEQWYHSGGYTVFPRVGVYVRPQLGSVLIYWNSDSSGQQDVLVVNSECPVVHGNKWGIHTTNEAVTQVQSIHVHLICFQCSASPLDQRTRQLQYQEVSTWNDQRLTKLKYIRYVENHFAYTYIYWGKKIRSENKIQMNRVRELIPIRVELQIENRVDIYVNIHIFKRLYKLDMYLLVQDIALRRMSSRAIPPVSADASMTIVFL